MKYESLTMWIFSPSVDTQRMDTMTLKMTCIRIQPDIWKALDAVAAAQGISKGAMLRQWMAIAVRAAQKAA
jgi:hypothetical protein